MAGGTQQDSRIAARFIAMADAPAAERGCAVFTSDLRVLVESAGLYTYPDVSVVRGEPALADSRRDVLLNPVLLVEVLSPSTEQYDRGTKAKLYRTIPSLRECLLISRDCPEAELYRRESGDHWSILTANGLDASVELSSIAFRLSLRDLYRGILPAA